MIRLDDDDSDGAGGLIDAIHLLTQFIERADALWPEAPTLTLSFRTPDQMWRMRAQLQATGRAHATIMTKHAYLPPGVDASIGGVHIILKLRT